AAPSTTTAAAASPFAIQTGAFQNARNADRRLAALQAGGFPNAFSASRGELEIVYAGGYRDRNAATADLGRVRRTVGDAFIVAR
ncbi:MAG: SPOR domain-containing protein, partial [Pseudomonadota bacterium]